MAEDRHIQLLEQNCSMLQDIKGSLTELQLDIRHTHRVGLLNNRILETLLLQAGIELEFANEMAESQAEARPQRDVVQEDLSERLKRLLALRKEITQAWPSSSRQDRHQEMSCAALVRTSHRRTDTARESRRASSLRSFSLHRF